MINRVTSSGNDLLYKQDTKAEQQACGYIKKYPYADSFVRHAAKSAPVLGTLAVVWALHDHKMLKNSLKTPLKTLLKNNFLYYFLPVITVSSAVLAILENKKNTKEN